VVASEKENVWRDCRRIKGFTGKGRNGCGVKFVIISVVKKYW
jgi:hypothetical protein